MHRDVVIITDCSDIAAAELRAAIRSVSSLIWVEPPVFVDNFSILNGNFAFRLMAEAYPKNVVFLSTINPLKVRPKSVIGRTHKGQIFIGRNTGVFDWITRDFGCEELIDISGQATEFNKEFKSFTGKLVTAPIAGKLAVGSSAADFGPKIDAHEILRLDIGRYTIVHIDNFGMMKFTGQIAAQDGEKLDVSIGSRQIVATYCRRLMDLNSGEWALFPGSSFGLFELGQCRRHGAQSVGAVVGDRIDIRTKS